MSLRNLFLAFPLALSLASAETGEEPLANHAQPRAPKIGFGVQLGMNGIAGIAGVTGTFYPLSNVAVDLGASFGATGVTTGLRARGFFLESRHMHPYAGLGFRHGSGTGNTPATMEITKGSGADSTTYKFDATIAASNFADAQAGIEFRWGAFQLRPVLGWSQRLGGRNWKVVSGTAPDSEISDAMDLIMGSGPTIALESGFAF